LITFPTRLGNFFLSLIINTGVFGNIIALILVINNRLPSVYRLIEKSIFFKSSKKREMQGVLSLISNFRAFSNMMDKEICIWKGYIFKLEEN
jgi:hypothetical protein